MPASQVIQQAQQSQVALRGQPTSFVIVDDHQPGPSRPFTFTLTPAKHFNPLSLASVTGEESQHNMSGLSSFFANLQSVMSYHDEPAVACLLGFITCPGNFPSSHGEKHPNPKSGQEVVPDKPGCIASCWGGETDPNFLHFFPDFHSRLLQLTLDSSSWL